MPIKHMHGLALATESNETTGRTRHRSVGLTSNATKNALRIRIGNADWPAACAVACPANCTGTGPPGLNLASAIITGVSAPTDFSLINRTSSVTGSIWPRTSLYTNLVSEATNRTLRTISQRQVLAQRVTYAAAQVWLLYVPESAFPNSARQAVLMIRTGLSSPA